MLNVDKFSWIECRRTFDLCVGVTDGINENCCLSVMLYRFQDELGCAPSAFVIAGAFSLSHVQTLLNHH